jgi:lipooligosaccharide transport system ATP-binding protein
MAIIKIEKLTKMFKDLTAVDRVSLNIEPGECFGFLGPNGAGKTTLVRMITAVTPPDSGDICVLGRDLKKYPRQIKVIFGVVPQIDNLDPELSVMHNLTTFARYFDIPNDEARRRATAALQLFKLEAKVNSRIKELSGGMKRRLLMARGLINNPKILVLDEPSVGLDPQSKHLVWQKLKELKGQGVTQLVSTQNMDEATILCDRVAIMHLGRILALEKPKELIARHVGDMVLEIEVRSGEREKITTELKRRKLDYEDAGGIIQVFQCKAGGLIEELGDYSWNMWSRLATLEDVFFRLTGRGLIE